jgi:hypothetical protein
MQEHDQCGSHCTFSRRHVRESKYDAIADMYSLAGLLHVFCVLRYISRIYQSYLLSGHA